MKGEGNRMKKIKMISTIFFLVLALSGCSQGTKEPEKQNKDEITDTDNQNKDQISDTDNDDKQEEATELKKTQGEKNESEQKGVITESELGTEEDLEVSEEIEQGTEEELELTTETDQETESESDLNKKETKESKDMVEPRQIMIEEHIITTDNKTIYGKIYMPEEEGKYPAVILSHGYNGINSDFVKECKYFAENGYVAYAYDFCGGSTRSKSSGATTDMTLLTEKDDLLTVYEDISSMDKVDSEQIFLFGGSQGGMVSALVAEELNEKVVGMILYFPAFSIPDDWRAKYPTIDNVPETIDFWGMNLGRDFVTSIHDFYVFDTSGKYSGDVLIIYGQKDPIVAAGYMEKAEKAYQSAELIVLENEAHGFSLAGGKFAMEQSLKFMNERKDLISQ